MPEPQILVVQSFSEGRLAIRKDLISAVREVGGIAGSPQCEISVLGSPCPHQVAASFDAVLWDLGWSAIPPAPASAVGEQGVAA